MLSQALKAQDASADAGESKAYERAVVRKKLRQTSDDGMKERIAVRVVLCMFRDEFKFTVSSEEG
ncbi:hypothetical protein E4U12_001417, partial [Claviceps purpurea]